MMVVDTSALLAILLDEQEKALFEQMLAAEEQNIMSALSLHEAGVVMRGRHGPSGVARLLSLVATHSIGIVVFDEGQALAALKAFDRFGKGIHPKARLNLCDCAAYALATTRAAPLLFKGDDFPHTDILAAV